MFKTIKTILFPTNLSESCRLAFDYVAAIATRFQATIVLLHVIDKMPEFAVERLRGMLGNDQWEQLQKRKEYSAREVLIGKRSSNAMIQEALEQFCNQVGINDASCGYHTREIVISHGEPVKKINHIAKKYQCDLIIMGARDGCLTNNSIGPTIKSVMRKSTIPVMVVPPTESRD
jgi:nucleotide-binding universal stress UspA family protein